MNADTVILLRKYPGALVPEFRHKLKARIHDAGFRLVKDYCRVCGIPGARMSRFLSGYEYPTAQQQQKIADALGITLIQLRSLL